MLAARRQIGTVSGIEHIVTPHPFIVALNHTTRREALLVPALMIFRRGGRRIHFLVDWMFALMPGAGFLFRRAGTIAVTNKPARPRALNAARPLFLAPTTALERARALLLKGNSVGIFPEGTVNRNPERLLPGRYGAARLSLETGVPIVPVGIRYPGAAAGGPVPENAAMEVFFGAPLTPPEIAGPVATTAEVRAWHAVMMGEIARLSGRAWSAPSLAA
jgi:1-acyl-sn-glycerol-3-phosphate acyltransferase